MTLGNEQAPQGTETQGTQTAEDSSRETREHIQPVSDASDEKAVAAVSELMGKLSSDPDDGRGFDEGNQQDGQPDGQQESNNQNSQNSQQEQAGDDSFQFEQQDDSGAQPQQGQEAQGSDAGQWLSPAELMAARNVGISVNDAVQMKAESPTMFQRFIAGQSAQFTSHASDLLNRYQQAQQYGQQPQVPNQQHVGSQNRTQQEANREDVLKAIYGDKLTELRDEVGEGVLDKIVAPLVSRLNNEIAPLRQELAARQNVQVSQTINAFLSHMSAGPFKDFYGTGKEVKPEQVAHRRELAGIADQLRTAAMAVEGRDMGVDEALSAAHELVTARYASELARSEIRNQLKNRQASYTNRPSGSRGTTTPPTGDQRAVSAVAAKMKEMGV